MRKVAAAVTLAAALALPAATDAQDTAPGTTVPVRVLRQGTQALVVANVHIQGHTYRFVVDTGASGSIVDASVARKLGLKKAGRPQAFQGVGCSGSATPVKIKDWRIGAVDLPALTIASADTGLAKPGIKLAGLLGSDVLQTFGKVSIDYRGSQLAFGR
jgi:predicted aspartyl protease